MTADSQAAFDDPVRFRRALLSVSDKTGIVELARALADARVDIVSTGSTAALIADSGVPVTQVSEVTGFAEALDGRVKTLHPAVHAGILADLRLEDHARQLAELGIAPFELVVVNLYPFAQTVWSGADDQAVVEQIDIGGPAMVRSAAKNHANVAVVTDPRVYPLVARAAETGLTLRQRKALAREAFAHTAAYDAAVARWFAGESVDAQAAGVEAADRGAAGVEAAHDGAASVEASHDKSARVSGADAGPAGVTAAPGDAPGVTAAPGDAPGVAAAPGDAAGVAAAPGDAAGVGAGHLDAAGVAAAHSDARVDAAPQLAAATADPRAAAADKARAAASRIWARAAVATGEARDAAHSSGADAAATGSDRQAPNISAPEQASTRAPRGTADPTSAADASPIPVPSQTGSEHTTDSAGGLLRAVGAATLARGLRYGENSHQVAGLFALPGGRGITQAELLHGKPMSFNNYVDADAALRAAYDFPEPAVAVIKHANPCGIAVGARGASDPIASAHERAHACDPISAFGGVVAANRPVTAAMAETVAGIFTEVVVAPDFEQEALELLSAKKNVRLLRLPADYAREGSELRQVSGGLLVQQPDTFDKFSSHTWRRVSGSHVSDAVLDDLEFAWRACRAVKSNAILLAAGGASVGIGMGQVNRVDSCSLAVVRAGDRATGSVAASDAFFPFADGLQILIDAGVAAVVQPGGSVRDEEVVAAAEAAGITMYFTGERHFAH